MKKKKRTSFREGMSLVELQKDQSPAMQDRFWEECRRVGDVMPCCMDRDDYKVQFIEEAVAMGVGSDIVDEMRRWYGLGSDDSDEGREIDSEDTQMAIAFKRIAARATSGHQPTKDQIGVFMSTAREMGLDGTIKPITDKWGGWSETGADESTDYGFVSRLIESLGKNGFIQMVCSSGSTTRDGQNLLGALHYGESGFSQHADKDVIRRLGDLDLV